MHINLKDLFTHSGGIGGIKNQAILKIQLRSRPLKMNKYIAIEEVQLQEDLASRHVFTLVNIERYCLLLFFTTSYG